MPGVSIHVVDVAHGRIAQGMKVELYAIETSGTRQLIAKGRVDENGLLASPELLRQFAGGYYEAVFHIADFYREKTGSGTNFPFLDVVNYRFGIARPDEHYHLPMKCTPWGYSCFRGGA